MAIGTRHKLTAFRLNVIFVGLFLGVNFFLLFKLHRHENVAATAERHMNAIPLPKNLVRVKNVSSNAGSTDGTGYAEARSNNVSPDPHIDQTTRNLLNTLLFFRGEKIPASSSTKEDGITVSTQMDVGPIRLQRLVDLASRWEGFISVVVYLVNGNESASKELHSFLHEHDDLFKKTIVHLIMDMRIDEPKYPINILRNIAMEHAPTKRVLLLDVDFLPSPDSYNQLMAQLSSGTASGERIALILPAFERKLKKGEDEVNPLESFGLPQTKAELLSLIANEPDTFSSFHVKNFPEGHGPTKFDLWYNSSQPYPIKYQRQFEPYFVIHKDDHLPLFWEYFAGFGHNKWSWVAELSFAGYQFMVAPECFLVHVNHKYEKNRKYLKQPDHELKYHFEKHVQKKYGKDATVWRIDNIWWKDLSDKMRAAAILMGFDQKLWDENGKSPTYEALMAKTEFSEDEIDAIETLGFQKYFKQIAW